LGEIAELLFDRLGLRVQMKFVLKQFPRNSRHVSRLPCEDVPIFLEEYDERKFLFGIQGVAFVSNLRRFLYRQWDLLADCVLPLDGLFGGLGVRHDRLWGDSAMASLNFWSSMDAASLSVVSQLSLSQS
jgi:hypothetical protein